MIVELSEEQRRYGFMIAKRRMNESRKRRCQNRHGIVDDDGRKDRTGACGELAASIALGLNCRLTVNTFKGEPDLVFRGWPVEVRTSTSRRPQIFFRDRDDPNSILLLVSEVEHGVRYRMEGWAIGSEIAESGKPSGDPSRTQFPAFGVDELTPFRCLMDFPVYGFQGAF